MTDLLLAAAECVPAEATNWPEVIFGIAGLILFGFIAWLFLR